jgi:hypothetical protein
VVLNSNRKDSLDGNISVKSIYIKGTDTLTTCGYTITCANWFRVAGTGLWLVDSTVTITGDGGFKISANQVMTASATWRLDFQGDDSLMTTRTFINRGITAAYPGKTLWVGASSGVMQFTNGGDTTVFLKGGTLTMNHGTTSPAFNLYPTLSGCPLRVGGTTINGTGHWGFGHGSQSGNFKISIPKLQITAGTVTFCRNTASDTIMITDTVAITGNVTIFGSAGSGQSFNFNSGNKPFSCTKTLTTGAGASAVNNFYWNRSVVACSAFVNTGATYNRNTQAHYDSASTWTVKDVWAWGDTPTVSWSEGGSVTFIQNTGSKTLTSNGHAFQDMIINCSGQLVTQADSGQYARWKKLNGRWSCGGYNMRITRCFLDSSLSNIDTTTLACQVTLTGAKDTIFLHWKDTSGVTNIAASTWNPQGDCIWHLDSHKRTISRLICATGKTQTFHPPDSLAIKNWSSGNWSGAVWQSSTPGTYYFDSLPASTTPAALDVQDCWNYGQVSAPDSTCINHGHTYGFTWRKARIDSINVASGPAAGGTAVRVRGKYFVFDGAQHVYFGSIAAANQATYTTRNDSLCAVNTPAHTAGVVNVIVVTSDSAYGGDSAKDTLVGAYTYTGASAPPIIAYVTGKWSVASGAAISDSCVNTGGPVVTWAHKKDLSSNGITFSTTTGKQSGTTTGRLVLTIDTVIATNADGADTAWDTITVLKPGPAAYITSPATAVVGTAFSDSVYVQGDAYDSIHAVNALPAGLSKSATGKIVGTPTTVTAQATYKFYIYLGNRIQDSASLVLTVNPAKPAPGYAGSPFIDSTGQAASHAMTNTGGDGVVSVRTALPKGYTINSTTGLISKAATGDSVHATANWVVIDSNVTGKDSATITLTVVPEKPVLTYPSLSLRINAATTLTPSEASGSLDSVKVTSGTLPAGLSITKETGAISGTPTTAGTTTVTATAWNVSGSRAHTLVFSVSSSKAKSGVFSKGPFRGGAFR